MTGTHSYIGLRRGVSGLALCLLIAGLAIAQSGTLAEPFPEPSPNAALHYQRALLLMASVDQRGGDLRAVLRLP